jgi:enoyl-CoA hydratase/carnithine racemase
MDYEYSEALLTQADGVATITLNRPETLNAFSPRMEDDIRAALAEIREDRSVRVVVITGAGRAFSSGADVKAWDARIREGGEPTVVERWQQNEARHAMPLGIYELGKPVIAAVNGAAVGMGMDMALACDMRIVSETARFAMLYIKRGLVPDEGGAWFLPRLVGPAKACELILTGDFVDGREAERIGLANRCVPNDQLMAVTQELAAKIAAGPPVAIEFVKRAIREGMSLSLRSHFDAIGYYMGIVNQTEDVAEGMRAFVESRAPRFSGR